MLLYSSRPEYRMLSFLTFDTTTLHYGVHLVCVMPFGFYEEFVLMKASFASNNVFNASH